LFLHNKNDIDKDSNCNKIVPTFGASQNDLVCQCYFYRFFEDIISKCDKIRIIRFQYYDQEIIMKRKSLNLTIIFIFLGLSNIISACNSSSSQASITLQPETTPSLRSEDLTLERLKNMEYLAETSTGGRILLQNGEFRELAAPGSASEIVYQLLEPVAYGRLNDGRDAAAVVLFFSGGGSGNFRQLSLVTLQDNQPFNIAKVLLGDRVDVRSVSFENGKIIVEMVTQGPNDPRCCPQTLVKRVYALNGDQLVQESETILGKLTPTP
jgi:hypothetical protein